jgi:hypothetical protein
LLTNKKIDGAKPTAKPYKLTDAHGLYIHILPTGSKSWRYNYTIDGGSGTQNNGHMFANNLIRTDLPNYTAPVLSNGGIGYFKNNFTLSGMWASNN